MFPRPPPSPFDRPSFAYTIYSQPVKTLIRLIHHFFNALRSSPPRLDPQRPIRVVCISDTHTLKPSSIPDGDLLIHAGDLTNAGTIAELQEQINWIKRLPHDQKVVIAGNHDTWLDPRSRVTLSKPDQDGRLDWGDVKYLQHSQRSVFVSTGGSELSVYGAPQIPACGGKAFAFQYSRGTDAWSDTLPRTDILVTHTPPKHHLDLPAALGCERLLASLWQLDVKPRLHIFGHIHAGRSDFFGHLKGGKEVVRWDREQRCLESVLSMPDGFLREVLDLRSWIALVRVASLGLIGVLWERIWGGESETTVMVNAALMYESTGMLGNEPQVIEI